MIAGVVLAAGTSTRFGATKQLVVLDGRPLVLHAVQTLRDGGIDTIMVVTGHDASKVRAVLPAEVIEVHNERFRDGQATSLSVALHEVPDEAEAVIVLLADQPGVTAEEVRALIDAFRRSRARIVRLRYLDGPGPALLSREIFAEAAHLHGDAGARVLMASHPEWVDDVPVDRPAPTDVDEPADLDAVKRAMPS